MITDNNSMEKIIIDKINNEIKNIESVKRLIIAASERYDNKEYDINLLAFTLLSRCRNLKHILDEIIILTYALKGNYL